MGEFLGNLLGGAAQGGSSGSIGAGRGNIKQKNNYIGENDAQKPLEDTMALLAAEANQQRAQRNLIGFGAGYGGSFESADQRAARAAGETLTQKPFGGWGGYGSESPVQAWDPTNTRPDWAKQGAPPPTTGTAPPVPPTAPPGPPFQGQPAPPPELPVTPASPPSGGSGTPTPPPQGPGNPPPKGTPWNGDTGGFTMEAFLQALQQAIGGQAPTNQAAAPGTSTQPAAKTGATGDEANLAARQKKYREHLESQGLKFSGRYPPSISPEVQNLKKALVAKGMNPQDDFQGDDVLNALEAGVPMSTIQKHYETVLSQLGPKAFSAAHGAFGRLQTDELLKGTQTQSTLANARGETDPTRGKPTAGKAAPPGGAGMTQTTAPQSYAMNSAAVAPGAENLTQTVEPPAAYATNSASAVPPGGENMTQTVPPEEGEGDGFDASQYGPYFQQIWDQYQAALKDNIGGLNQDTDSDDGTITGTTGGGNGGGGGGSSDIAANMPQRASPFGPQGNNPDYEPGETTTKPGYSGGDTWSTGAGWRPEEPTGGLYGAYSELAGGKMTPYENRILEGWQGRAVDPTGWADEDTYAAINQYAKTPGRGEDEAFGAYNKMLQGGYSPEEQNAITQEGMKAARAGFETNRDAMLRNQSRTGNSAGYAANMGKMARGFGETMGSQARQNQITFADEAQRRATTGAQGMLGVAGLANQRGQATIQARQGFGNELARRQETALGGSKDMAAYGRGLQQQGLQGLHALYAGQDPTKQWATAAGIASNPRETYTESGNASL